MKKICFEAFDCYPFERLLELADLIRRLDKSLKRDMYHVVVSEFRDDNKVSFVVSLFTNKCKLVQSFSSPSLMVVLDATLHFVDDLPF